MTGTKFNKSAYDIAYRKSNIKQIAFSLNRERDKDIIEHLESVDNTSAYIKDLIRTDIEK